MGDDLLNMWIPPGENVTCKAGAGVGAAAVTNDRANPKATSQPTARNHWLAFT